MKKQSDQNGKDAPILDMKSDRVSRVLLTIVAVIYCVSLVMLANLVLATGVAQAGGLIKISSDLNAGTLDNVKVKSVHGNILAIETNDTDLSLLSGVNGICASQLDHTVNRMIAMKTEALIAKYDGASVVLGILDNSGVLSSRDLTRLQKMQPKANVGFISSASTDLRSTVIMRNLYCGESNLVQALAYMQQYAIAAGRPLIIEMVLNGNEMQNPLFVQVCQQVAESGVQFIDDFGLITEPSMEKLALQFAFCTFNAETGQITDRSDFWAISEVEQEQLMLLGSDERACTIFFRKEAGFDKIYISNASSDVTMIMVLRGNGEVNYYHVASKETAFIPRILFNGTPVLEDGLTGIYPYFSKKAFFNGAMAQN